MDVQLMFKEQLEKTRFERVFFFGYEHPNAKHKCEVFEIERAKLDLLPYSWEPMKPLYPSEGSAMPRLKFKAPK